MKYSGLGVTNVIPQATPSTPVPQNTHPVANMGVITRAQIDAAKAQAEAQKKSKVPVGAVLPQKED